MTNQPPAMPDTINPQSPPESPQRPNTDPMPQQPDELQPVEPDTVQPGVVPQEVPAAICDDWRGLLETDQAPNSLLQGPG
jgi:hypothetical protein